MESVFEDGNGRIARALTDMALAQDERLRVRFYSLSSQIMEERNEYYTILEQCQKGDVWNSARRVMVILQNGFYSFWDVLYGL